MKTDFKNLQQLFSFFDTEEKCKEYYADARWGGNVVCPHCGHGKVYTTNRGYKCANKECYKKFTVTIGTIFENSKVPLQTWFAAMFLISSAKKGISSVQLSVQLGITQKTAWFVLHRIREMLKETSSTGTLNGMVEVDETYVGGKNKNRHADKKVENSQGRASIDKTPVVGLVERGGRILTFVAENTEQETLHQIIDNNVSNEAIIVTDAYKSYAGLSEKYTHIIVKHESGGYVK
jgi:transposase-like protein